MNIETILREAQKKLEGKTHSKKLDAEILLMKTLSVSRSFLISHNHEMLTNEETKEYYNLIERRLDKEPIAYIIGEKEFWSFFMNEINNSNELKNLISSKEIINVFKKIFKNPIKFDICTFRARFPGQKRVSGQRLLP